MPSLPSSGRRVGVILAVSLASYGAVYACASHVPSYILGDGGEGAEGSAEGPLAEAEGDGGEPPETAPPSGPTARVRFALWSPDTPAADFCVAPLPPPTEGGATMGDAGDAGDAELGDAALVWQGPLLAQAASDVDGGTGVFTDATPPGLTFPEVTTYFALPAGAYVVRGVLAGSSDCELPVLPSDVTLPLLADSTYSTVAVVGDYAQAARDFQLAVVWFSDDRTAEAGSAAVRFIAALPSVGRLDLSLGPKAGRSLFSGVAFGTASDMTESDAGKVDPNGYLAIAPITSSAVTVGVVDGGAPALEAEGLSVAAGSVVTLAAVGGKTGDTSAPPRLLLCVDPAPAVDAVFGQCSLLPSPSD